MKKNTWIAVAASVALTLAGAPVAVGSYPCDQGCDEAEEGSEGPLDLCKTLEEGESGAMNCFTLSTRVQYEDGTVEWSYDCDLIWGGCKEASGVWLYPIA